MRSLYMACHLDNMTGYGQQNCSLVSGLQLSGIQVTVFATGLADKPEPLPAAVQKSLVTTGQDKPSFLIQPPNFRGEKSRFPQVWLTMWEATKLAPEWVKRMNQSTAIITPSDWNASCFSACGVTVPIYQLPLFVPSGYAFTPPVEKAAFVFGCSGHLGSQLSRKNLSAAVQAFTTAFPNISDVRLHIKIGPYDHIEIPNDPRIQVTKGHLSHEEMKAWYGALDVFVHPSKSEGWGYQPLQAMALGRPVVACKYGGVAEYFDHTVGLVVEHEYEAADGMFTGHGHWACPKMQSLVDSMRYCYAHPAAVSRLGVQGAARALQFSLTNTVERLQTILEVHNVMI